MKYLIAIIFAVPFFMLAQPNENFVAISGTGISLIKPADYKISSEFKGFVNDDNKIEFSEFKGVNYFELIEKFSENIFKNKKGKLISNENLKINNYDAKLILIENDTVSSWQLLMGDKDFFIFSVSILKDTSKKNIEEVKKTLLSIQYQKNKKANPYEKAKFFVDDSNSNYKFSKEFWDIYSYTLNGVREDNFKKSNISYLIEEINLKEEQSPKEVFDNEMNKSYYNYLGFDLEERIATDVNQINGQNCYQELHKGMLLEKETIIKFTVIVKGKTALSIQAMCGLNDKNTQLEFDKITETITIK